MAFGDKPGVGFEAKLQHLMGVHYCDLNKTLYVADTYNHKIKTIKSEELGQPIEDWVGIISGDQKVIDGKDA